MGKVKSAIITALLTAAIIVLALFATISCNVPGSNGVNRYNSFISKIPLGRELTGEAGTTVYADGVITKSKYELDVYGNAEKASEYADKYSFDESSGYYIEKDKLGEDDGAALAESVAKDAEIISNRFSLKGYSSYSVSVVNKYAIKICVPTGFSYAAYKGYDSSERSTALEGVSHAVSYFVMEGGLDLRDGESYEDSHSLITNVNEDFNTYFSGASYYAMGGNFAVRLKVTENGFEKLNSILDTGDEDSDSQTLYLFVGENNLTLTFSTGTPLEDRTLYFQTTQNYARDYSIILSSVISGGRLQNAYHNPAISDTAATSIVTFTPSFGKNAPVFFGVFVLIIILLAAVLPIFKYKKLGLVNALMVLTYSVALVTAILLTGAQLTIAGALVAAFGLAALCFSNFYTFEAIRKQISLGNTFQTSVKRGYKNTLFAVLDIHVVLVVAAVLMALVGVGELASCGLIFVIGSIASIILYWFTRFMWFVTVSPARNKFSFCGYEREVDEDDD